MPKDQKDMPSTTIIFFALRDGKRVPLPLERGAWDKLKRNKHAQKPIRAKNSHR